MIIRDMEEKDLNDIAILYEELLGQKSNIENLLRTFPLMNDSDNYILLVAEDNGKVIGTVMGIICLTMVADLKKFLVMEAVIVDENYRGNGVGKKMLLELETRAKRRGCSYIILVSGNQRKEAHKFYEAFGYGEDEAKGFRKFIDPEII
ncbi:GNAT family N-acetyltransferase [Desulfosporosinus sp. FKB]|uniref:GNAT family N-acetyltransferase n=1 Tax=Desulfosporosinus sp. FKB TaxID=1969835 RepID=UPI0014833D81|nr:GNAT family N-acetyltransferase [Desulfosporosinus sp. FKB]